MWYSFNNFESRSLSLQKENGRFSVPHMIHSGRSLRNSGAPYKVSPEMLAEYSSTLHSFSDISIFIDFALDSILGIADAFMGSFFIWDEYGKELVLKTARGQGYERLHSLTIKLREGVAGWVAEKGFPVLVEDIRQDSRFANIKLPHYYQTYSFLSIPLVSGNKLIGLINITEKESKRPFTEDDLEHATVFARHISLAYENLKVRTRLRQENEELNQKLLQMNEQSKQQEALVSIGKLASHLAHELNNPLDAIRRFINLALDQVGETGPAREFLLKAKQGVRRSLQVIRGLLELSGISNKTRLRQTEIHSMIEETIALVRHDANFDQIVIEKRFCDIPLIVEDCGLQTVFQNLFQNAYHAMKGVGTITIQTREQGRHAVVVVRDNGCGISESVRQHIFEPFFTTKDNGKGTGIGLTICREIIQRCGGHITVDPVEPHGAQFTIMLPLFGIKL